MGEGGLRMETRFRGEQSCAFSAILRFCPSVLSGWHRKLKPEGPGRGPPVLLLRTSSRDGMGCCQMTGRQRAQDGRGSEGHRAAPPHAGGAEPRGFSDARSWALGPTQRSSGRHWSSVAGGGNNNQTAWLTPASSLLDEGSRGLACLPPACTARPPARGM